MRGVGSSGEKDLRVIRESWKQLFRQTKRERTRHTKDAGPG